MCRNTCWAGRGNRSANEKLNIAGIGVGGQGGGDIDQLSKDGANIVALCDVDDDHAAGTFKKFPNARRYKDFRQMLDKENKNIDAVMVATPDHCHAPAAIRAMRMGKHVYVEKPMAHTIYEARRMTEIAKEKGVVTQMGQGGHAGEGLRLSYEFIHDGAIGPVREVHVWTDRPGVPGHPWWPQGIERPKDTMPDPREAGLEFVAGAGPLAALSQGLCPARLAGLVGIRLRRDGRYGGA